MIKKVSAIISRFDTLTMLKIARIDMDLFVGDVCRSCNE
jgi:hypothetical protein